MEGIKLWKSDITFTICIANSFQTSATPQVVGDKIVVHGISATICKCDDFREATRMATNPLLQRMAEMKTSLLNEGIINSEFLQLEMLEEMISGNNDLLAVTIDLCFQITLERINIVENELPKANPDFSVMDRTLHEFNESTIGFGAPKLTAAIAMMQECVKPCHLEFCMQAMQNLKEKQGSLQRKSLST